MFSRVYAQVVGPSVLGLKPLPNGFEIGSCHHSEGVSEDEVLTQAIGGFVMRYPNGQCSQVFSASALGLEEARMQWEAHASQAPGYALETCMGVVVKA